MDEEAEARRDLHCGDAQQMFRRESKSVLHSLSSDQGHTGLREPQGNAGGAGSEDRVAAAEATST